jgi:hypothetical protein
MKENNEDKNRRKIFNTVANNRGELFTTKKKKYPGLYDRPISKPAWRLNANNGPGLGGLGINA